MKDPALGRTRAQRALGEDYPKKKKKDPRLEEFRMVHNGQYDGVRASYMRYNVSEVASDALDRSKRNMDMR